MAKQPYNVYAYITPCSFCKLKEEKLGTLKLCMLMLIETSHDLNIWKYWWIMDTFRAVLVESERDLGEVWGNLFAATFSVVFAFL